MRAYRLETTLAEDGTLRLNALPFREGETVEVIVLEYQPASISAGSNSLKGSVLRYDDPTEPVSSDVQ